MAAVTKNPLDINTVNFDDSDEHNAFLDAWLAKGIAKTHERLRELHAMGIIDEKGDLIPTHTPPDMLDPNSSVEQ